MATLDVQVGDKVILNTRGGRYVEEVERLTNKFIIVNGAKYRKQSGRQAAGDAWSPRFITTASDEEIVDIKRQNTAIKVSSYLSRFDYSTLSPESVIAVYRELKKQIDVSEGEH